MENNFTADGSPALLVCLYSEPNFLAVNILENLLTQKCFVNIVTTDTSEWESRTRHIASKNRFTISESVVIKNEFQFNYVIYSGGFFKKANAYDNLSKLLQFDKLRGIKTLAILPYEAFDSHRNSMLEINSNLGVIYVGDLVGARIDLASDLLVSSAIGEVRTKNTLTLAIGEMFYPIFVVDAVRQICKWLFSFGPYGHEIFLLGTSTSGSQFWQELQKVFGEISLKYRNDLYPRTVPRNFEIKNITSNLRVGLSETYKWVGVNTTRTEKVVKKIVPPKIVKPVVKPKRVYPKYLRPLVLVTTILLILPFLTIATSLGFFALSYKGVISGKTTNTEKQIFIAKSFSVFTREESRILSFIPLLGRVYRELYFAGELGDKISDISLNAIPLVKSSSDLFNHILGDEIYNPEEDSENIKLGLDYLNRSVLDLEAVTLEELERGTYLSKKLLNVVNFDKIKRLTSEGQSLAANIPELLGVTKRKSYLVLFQNNMELRPTGGFIGSYGIMTFDGGRMSDLTVNDVYSADGQLNGHVEPPAPIKNYLGEANWWLRDSNWDPDFPTSAKRAEWFLDKEVGRQVDGVISTDLYPIKEILKSTGPIFLADFNLSIDDKNIYEKTQSEVQDNFFPGTRKKGSFLTALSRNLLAEVSKIDSGKKLFILRSLLDGFEERHLQAYIHDPVLQKSLGGLLWDGAVSTPTCGDLCYPDFVGLVEANVGVNKSNYFVTRNISLDVKASENELNRVLTLNLKNSASTALGPSGKYKVYLRILLPLESELVGVNTVSQGEAIAMPTEITELKGRREVGVLVEVLGGTDKTVQFSWKSNFQPENINSYGLYIRKQAGVGEDPLNVSFKGLGGRPTSIPTFSLTKDGTYSYNTTLGRDFFSRLNWKN